MQLTATFSSPSSNHLMLTSPVNDVFLILVGFFIQSRRTACSAQKASGSSTERRYMAS